MKRVLSLLLILFLLLPLLPGLSEEEIPALYPIRESGLWGYMNRQGEVVIAPQWDDAKLFSQGRAVIAHHDSRGNIQYGLIDIDGE